MDDDILLFGLTLAEFESISLKVCLAALVLYMLFIIGNLAKESKAGRYGTIWLFVVLGLGFLGFVSKGLIQKILGIE